jgi:sugar phosphate isomerase/epimerase
MPATRPAPDRQALTVCAMSARGGSLQDRVQAARIAGFDSIGMSMAQYRAARAGGLTDRGIARILEDNGIAVAEFEMVELEWGLGPSARSTKKQELLHAMHALSCRQFNAVDFGAGGTSQRAEGLAALACSLREIGSSVALEFMPFSSIPSADAAVYLVNTIGADNVGYVLDCWHIARSKMPDTAFSQLAPDRLLSVQLCDPLPEPMAPMQAEARRSRLLPGAFATHVLTQIKQLMSAAQPRLSVEVWSDLLEQIPIPTAMILLRQSAQQAISGADPATLI